jgi:hypothetical protein
MTSDSDDAPYRTWEQHPDAEVEQIFREANQAGYVIYRHEGIYTLVSPDAMKDYQFLGRVVASSAAWRHMVGDLKNWLAQTAEGEAEGQG